MAAFDVENPEAVVSPGGVGFDINCGVRLIRTNLHADDLMPVKEELTQLLFDYIPVGVGSRGILPTDSRQLSEVLEMGMDWSVRQGYAWAEDKEHAEEYGRMLAADPTKVSPRARKRGVPQLGTLGAGNHYAEVQVVEKIYDKQAAAKMGIEQEGQVCVFVHSGSRGLGHQVATDALVAMEAAMARDRIQVQDRQLACARIGSPEGQDYLAAMAAASNFAWVNRATMTFLCRQAFAKQFGCSADDLDMNVVYDVSHNIAKMEQHLVDGRPRQLLVVHLSTFFWGSFSFFALGSSQGCHSCVWSSSPSGAGGLSVHGTACFDWWHHGDVLLRAYRNRSGHGGDVGLHVPRCWPCFVSEPLSQRAGSQRRASHAGRQGHLDSSGLAQTHYGRSARVLQGCRSSD